MQYKTVLAAIPATLIAINANAASENPSEKPDNTWTSISGTVTSVDSETFKLDYGDGLVTVEMDDWDSYNETFNVSDGDAVKVFGEVDKDFYETASIEASSVYVEDLNSYFYASDADEEELGDWVARTPMSPGDTTYVGNVESVDMSAGTFTIDTGSRQLTVDTQPLPYNPLDEEGFQEIEAGERVSVNGVINDEFFENGQLEAESVVTLKEDVG